MKTKKLFLMAAMLLMSVCSFAQNNNTPLLGDVNGDGKVDVADIVAILKIMKDAGGTTEEPTNYWYVGNNKPSYIDTSDLKTLQTEIGWHVMDSNVSIINIGQCAVSTSSPWYICIPIINNSAFTKVLSAGIDITSTYNILTESIDGINYTIFQQKETSKKIKCDISK